MSSVLEYIHKNPQQAQRLVGLKYEQLKKLIARTEELPLNPILKNYFSGLQFNKPQSLFPFPFTLFPELKL